jgi:hypothetical protein
MLAVRRVAFKILPLLGVSWATLVLVGGAVHPVKLGTVTQDTAVKTGLGLCAFKVAFLMSTGTRRVVEVA